MLRYLTIKPRPRKQSILGSLFLLLLPRNKKVGILSKKVHTTVFFLFHAECWKRWLFFECIVHLLPLLQWIEVYMTCAINFCRCAIFKRLTQFRLLRRECGHLWHANFHVDIQYSFMSYRHTFINCLFFYSHSTNQLRNQIVFSNYFHYSLLVWIFGMERLPLKNVNLDRFCVSS